MFPMPRLIAAGLLVSAAGLAIAEPVQAPPAAETVRADGFTVTALRDMINAVPNDGKVFGKDAGVDAVATALRDAGRPTDTVTLGVDALLVRGSGHTVLIDTGLGPKVGGALMASLAKAGVDPAAIDAVLITHSHGDHVGGLLTAQGTLAFPKAAIRLSEDEWTWMQAKGNPALVAAIRPRVRTFRPGSVVTPGIRAVAVPGHTPGHVVYRIGSGATGLLDIGDLAHSTIVSLGHPEWIIGFDTDPLEGRASREAWLAQLARSGQRVFAPHFPYPGIGRIVARDRGYAWQPEAIGR